MGVAQRPSRYASRLVWLTLGFAVAVGAVGVVGFPADRDPGGLWMTATMGLAYTALGAFVLRRVPGHAVGRLMLLIGVLALAAALALSWSAYLVAAWLSQWLWWPPISLIPVLLLLFPDGRLPTRRWAALGAILLVAAAVTALSIAVAAAYAPRTFLTSLASPTPLVRRLALVAVGGVGVVLMASMVVLVAQVLRWRRASPIGRRQLACLLPSGALLVVGVLLDYVNVPGAWIATVVILPIGMTFAIVQYRFYDLDLYVNRGLVWLFLTGITVTLFSVILYGVTTVATTWGRVPTVPGTLVAGSVTAAVLLPAERLAQRWVSRLLYGRRDEPFSVLVRLGHHVEAVRDPLAVLPQFVATVSASLRIPYAAVLLASTDGSDPVVVEHGRQIAEAEHFPLVAHGTELGHLVVATRRPGVGFSADERALLRGLAGQAAVAAEAVRSTMDLQRAREKLVLAREEERRALRNDLHDGVSASLLGARLKTAAISTVIEPDQARPHLQSLIGDLDACAAEIRSLIDGLRPAALDGGLEDALHRLADDSGPGSPQVEVEIAQGLGELPAAIEVAAYRIATEALTNVRKHAAARTCRIEVSRENGRLHVTVIDDGIGFGSTSSSSTRPDAVGLGSLRSRAEELGGSLVIDSPAEGGTRLWAVVPTHGRASGDT